MARTAVAIGTGRPATTSTKVARPRADSSRLNSQTRAGTGERPSARHGGLVKWRAAADKVGYSQRGLLQELPLHELPDHELPLHELPLHEWPVHELLHELPLQEWPDQE
jgi:hypothetical protein